MANEPGRGFHRRLFVVALLVGGVGLGCVEGGDAEPVAVNGKAKTEQNRAEAAMSVLSEIESPLLRAILEPLVPEHDAILADPQRYRLQILLAVPVANTAGEWGLERHGYRVDAEYFYPASTVKTAAALAALEAINRELSEFGPVGLNTSMRFLPQFEQVAPVAKDPSNLVDQSITISHEVRKLFLVSDNEAFNRLFELMGRDRVNSSMHRLGLGSFHVVHRLAEQRSADENRQFPEVQFLGDNDAIIARIRARSEELAKTNLQANEEPADLLVGRALYKAGELIDQPFDFSGKNRVELDDLLQLNVHLFRPDLLSDGPRLRLNEEQLALVREAMGQLPSESTNPSYDPSEVPDHYAKYLLPGLQRLLISNSADEKAKAETPAAIRVYNKVGRAYGFSIENAYVVDQRSLINGVPRASFFLSAVLYTNANQTLNDDDYEYEDADAFLADLGESVARALWFD